MKTETVKVTVHLKRNKGSREIIETLDDCEWSGPYADKDSVAWEIATDHYEPQDIVGVDWREL